MFTYKTWHARRSTCRTSLMLLILWLTLGQLVLASEKNSLDHLLHFAIERDLNPKRTFILFEQYFRLTPPEQYLFDANRSLALRSAWESLKRRALARHATTREDLGYFVGLMESRLRTRAPQWWVDDILAAETRGEGTVEPSVQAGWRIDVKYPDDQCIELDDYHMAFRSGLSLRIDGENVVIHEGSVARSLPQSKFLEGRALPDSMDARLLPDETFLVVGDVTGSYFFVQSFDSMGNRRWRADGWGEGLEGGGSGLWACFYEARVTDAEFFVFGSGNGSSFVEGFDRRTGRATVRFLTEYFYRKRTEEEN